MKYDLGNGSDQVQDYIETVKKTRKFKNLKDMKVKCMASDYAIAKWYAQSFKLNFDEMPDRVPNEKLKQRPDGREMVYDTVKKFLGRLEARGIPEKEIADHHLK